MKKNYFLAIGLLAVFTLALGFFACDNNTTPSGKDPVDTYHTVTFDPNGGNLSSGTSETKSVKDGDTLSLSPYSATKSDASGSYTFQGWYLSTDTSETTLTTVTVTGNITLKAKWGTPVPPGTKYTVTFDPNGGELSDGTEAEIEVDANTDLSLTDYKAEYEGGEYDFLGWYLSTDTDEKLINSITVTGDITLMAKWEDPDNTWTVTFNPNGGTLAAGTDAEKKVTKDAALPLKDNNGWIYSATNTDVEKVFSGWYLNTDTEEMVIEEIDSVTEDITLMAKWATSPPGDTTYTVTFNANGGQLSAGTEATMDVDIEEPLSLKDAGDEWVYFATRTDYEFIGWYIDGDADEEVVEEVTVDDATDGDITLMAKWKQIRYTVTFDPNGGTLSAGTQAAIKIDADKTLQLTNYSGNQIYTATGYDGHTFNGWFLSTDITEEPLPNIEVTSDITLMAKWRGGAVSVTLDLNGGAFESETPEMVTWVQPNYDTYTTPNTLPVGPDGKVFSYWERSDEDPSNPTHIKARENITIYDDSITLKAIWMEEGFWVTLELAGGTLKDDSGADIPLTYSVEPDENFVFPYSYWKPKKLGFVFAGWYIAPDDDILIDLEYPGIEIEQDTVITAKWEEAYIVTINLQDGEMMTDYQTGEPYPSQYTAAKGEPFFITFFAWREGYSFGGWYLDADYTEPFVDGETIITKDTDLYALWFDDALLEALRGVWTGEAGTYVLEYVPWYMKFEGSYFSSDKMGPIDWNPSLIDGKPASLNGGTLTIGGDDFTKQTLEKTPAYDAELGGYRYVKDVADGGIALALDEMGHNTGYAAVYILDSGGSEVDNIFDLGYLIEDDTLYLVKWAVTGFDPDHIPISGSMVLFEIPIVDGAPEGYTKFGGR